MENLKLVSFSNGFLQLHEVALQTFINQINPENKGSPVAILSIVGPPRSGKSFYSNLLIKFLQNPSNDWLTDLSSNGSLPTESLRGFAFENVTEGNIVPTNSDSGIYIWPQPLITKKYDGELVLFILHIHEFNEPNEHEGASYFLQLLLSLLCSRITEIKWSINKFCGFDFYSNESPITRSIVPRSMVCRSIVNLYRGLQRHLVFTQVPKEDLKTSSDDGAAKDLTEYASSYKAVYIDESEEPLHNSYGTLDITASMHSQIDHVIKSIADCNHMFPKLDEDCIPITLLGIQKYFSQCVSIVNECIKGHAQTESEKIQVSCHHSNRENVSVDTVENDTANSDQGNKEKDSFGETEEENAACTGGNPEIVNLSKDNQEKASLEQSITEMACLELKNAKLERTRVLEEQKRKEYENTCSKYVEEAIEFLELHIKNQLDLWLKEKLDISTADFCKGLYESSVEKMVEVKSSNNLSNNEMEKIQELARERTKNLKEKLERIHKIVTRFHLHVTNLMQSNVVINPEIFPLLLMKSYEIADLDEDVKACAKKGCCRLEKIYLEQNECIADYETKLLLTVCQDFRKIYNDKMSENIMKHHYSPKLVFDLHYEILILCVHNFRLVYQCGEVNDTFIGLEAEKELVSHLKKDYDTFRQLNLQKLLQLTTKTVDVISKQKAAYCSQMESILSQSPNGIPAVTFERQHFTIRNDVIKNMKRDLQNSIGKFEPTHGSEKVIMSHINLFWNNFCGLNFEKLNSPKDVFEKSSSAKDKKFELNGGNTNAVQNSGSSKTCSEYTLEDIGKTDEQKPLSPIIFTLSFSKIGTYIIYKNKLRTFGSSGTSVAVTVDELLVFGNDITSEIDKSKGHKVWNLSDYLLSAQNLEPREMLTIGETTYPIRTELLLGFLLYSLKQRVENECRGCATECVITIPFWFTSTQRQQVKHSGTCAGFLETHLVNENSTAALQYCRTSNDQGDNDIVVLSENSGSVYSSIYSYDKLHKVVKMTGYASLYDYNDFTNSKSQAVKDSLIQKIKATYKISQKMADPKLGFSSKKTVIVLSESDAWKDILITFGKSIEKMEKVCGFNEALIINGAVFLGANIKLNREMMKDWISASIFKRSYTYKEKLIQAKKGFIISATQQNHSVHDCFYWQEVEAIYYQKGITGQENEIGRLKWTSPYSRRTTIYLEISEESIVSTTLKHPSTSTSLTWYTQHLNETQIKIYLSLFESFEHTKKQIVERDSKKQDLIKQGNTLLERIQDAAFRSSLARDMAQKQIKESLEMLNHPKITAAEIVKQLETFQKYEARLRPK